MLSDEITAGAVKTTDEQKRVLAAQSHAFNLNSKKFRVGLSRALSGQGLTPQDIFPKYATQEMTDLPDMGVSSVSSQLSQAHWR